MTLLRSSFRNEGRNETSAKNLLCAVNDTMRVNFNERLFATAICLIISPDGKCMSYAQAGHPRLIRIDGKGKVQTIETNGIALGILSDQNAFSEILSEVSIPLVENDRFFLYTDGLTEAFNPNKDPYGTARLLNLLEGDIGNTPEKISRKILQDIKAFTQGAAYHDDLTFIVMCIEGR
jgi:serine phosphatase RsbU (regulator of sigma subunit)